jgi:hypothetical protein
MELGPRRVGRSHISRRTTRSRCRRSGGQGRISGICDGAGSRLHQSSANGQIRITDVDENLDETGFGSLEIKAQTLVNEDDMEVIRDSLEPGTSAAIIVYEESWARGVASAVRKAGGEVALHVQVPRDAVDAAVAVAASAD